MKSIKPEDFKVSKQIRLSELPTDLDIKASKKEKEAELEEVGRKLSELQDILYAHNRYGVLVCLQGMDTAGKDSLVREVFKSFNPRGVVVHSFKVPTSKELQHDYLWRHYIALPEKGKYAVFNRTHYENVLVTRVKPKYLLYENIPGIEKVEDVTPEFWDRRFEQINNFERHIAQNGIIVFKFYLHLSKEEQRQRLLRRLEEEKHNWKFSLGDLEDRALWDKYQECYEEAINRTSTPHAPWYVIPADDKQTARYMVAKVLLDEMSKYADIQEPELDPAIKANIEIYREKLAKKEL
jgi:PPK2 family polyphosphate:nucleotide phosphotransferase